MAPTGGANPEGARFDRRRRGRRVGGRPGASASAGTPGARRAWAAGIAGYVAMTVSALVVGILLGIQPLLFTDASGKPLYSPYDLGVAVPAMLVSHVFGASIVEGLIAGLGFAYFQKRHPEYLTSLRGVFGSDGVEVGQSTRRPLWQIVFPVVGIAFLVFTIYKNIEGTVAPYSRFPWYVLAWLAVGALVVIAAPHVAKRIGERLTSEIGEPPR